VDTCPVTQQWTRVQFSERQTVHRLMKFAHSHVVAFRDCFFHADVVIQLKNVELVVAGGTLCLQQVA